MGAEDLWLVVWPLNEMVIGRWKVTCVLMVLPVAFWGRRGRVSPSYPDEFIALPRDWASPCSGHEQVAFSLRAKIQDATSTNAHEHYAPSPISFLHYLHWQWPLPRMNYLWLPAVCIRITIDGPILECCTQVMEHRCETYHQP